MSDSATPQACPRCGCALLWNGRAMACIACSYCSADAKSEMKMPAARSRKKDRRPGGPSQP